MTVDVIALPPPGAAAVARSVRDGRTTGSAIADAVERRWRACEARLRAWAFLDPDLLRAAAEDGDRRGGGALRGVPFGVKDVIDVVGMPTRHGCALYADARPAATDAAVVALLREAGAVPVGKTVTAELAYADPGPTANPWNTAHTPGGSSSGSAAAVAAGVVPIALGTQTGGSVIRPAAYCGVVGFKASHGLLPIAGTRIVAQSLDSLGWFAGDVSGAALVGSVLLPWTGVPAEPPARVVVLPEEAMGTLGPEARAVLDGAAVSLRRAGLAVERADCGDVLAEVSAAQRVIMLKEMSGNLLPEVRAGAELLSPVLRSALEEGARIDAGAYMAARASLRRAREAVARLVGWDGVALTASAAGPAPRGLQSTGDSAFNRVWSALGWPAVHLPVGFSAAGLPLGVQLVAPHAADERLLRVAERLHPVLDRRAA